LLDADRDALLHVQDNLRHFWPMRPASVKQWSIVGLVQALLQLGRDEGAVTDAIPIDFLAMGWMGVLQQSRASGSSAASPARPGGTVRASSRCSHG